MTLRDVFDRLDDFGPEETIYAESATPTARAAVAVEGEDASGLPYLLEVAVAREAIEVWRAWRQGREPSLEEKLAAVIYYAEHDAWLPGGD